MGSKPKTLFINFSKKEIKSLKNLEEVDAELGFVDTAGPGHFFPSPSHDYDIVIAKIDRESSLGVNSEFPRKFAGWEDSMRLENCIPRGFYLGFLGENSGSLQNFGLSWVNTSNADPRDKIFNRANHYDSDFDFLFDKFAFRLPVKKYISVAHPLDKLRANNMGEAVAAYRQEFFYRPGDSLEKELKPTLLLVPFFDNTLSVVDEVLKLLKTVRSDLFPGLARQDWEEEEYFIPAEVLKIQNQISEKIKEAKTWIESKEKEIEAKKKEHGFLTQILKADDHNFQGDEKLSVNVKRVLEFLGFEVIDVDKELQKTIKKEDFWIVDGNYFALGEVTGTEAKNPKVTEYSGLLGRVATILKRKGVPRQLSQKGEPKGILIINHDRKSHPFSRPDIYTGENEEVVEAALDQGISILSAVELYKITKAVRDGELSKAEARKLIEAGGRIKSLPLERK